MREFQNGFWNAFARNPLCLSVFLDIFSPSFCFLGTVREGSPMIFRRTKRVIFCSFQQNPWKKLQSLSVAFRLTSSLYTVAAGSTNNNLAAIIEILLSSLKGAIFHSFSQYSSPGDSLSFFPKNRPAFQFVEKRASFWNKGKLHL